MEDLPIKEALKHLKWVEIINQENKAVKRNAMYIIQTDAFNAKLIFVDKDGNKRKVAGGKDTYETWLEIPGNEGKSVIEFIQDVSYLNSMELSIVDGELIVENYMGDSIEVIDGELILN